MRDALIYLQLTSLKNLLFVRLRRLKQPKYLFGAIVGIGYIYLTMVRPASGVNGIRTMPLTFPSTLFLTAFTGLGALILFVVVVLTWILPSRQAALKFSEAEIAFLFPAPVSRLTLIHYRLAKMQLMILVQALILTLISNRFQSMGGPAWIHALGWWCILATYNLHGLGAAFARTQLDAFGIGHWRRRLWIIAALLILFAGLWFSVRPQISPPREFDLINLSTEAAYISRILAIAPLSWVLAPFRWVVAPFFANSTAHFISALGPAFAVFALHYLWVLKANVPFEEASLNLAQKRSERVAAMRTGSWRGVRGARTASKEPFSLAPRGPVVFAFLWKNLLGAGPAYRGRVWLWIAVPLTLVLLWLRSKPGWDNALTIFGSMAVALSWMVLFIGPQFARQDFRTDLNNADLLKSYPLPGWKMALGQLLAPVAVLTGIQWLLLLVTAMSMGYSEDESGIHLSASLPILLGIALIVPFFYTILLIVPNAAALLFPAWVQAGRDGQRGIELMGQRLILVFGQMIMVLLAVLPAGACGAGAWFLTEWLIGRPAAISLAACLTIGVFIVEIVFGVWLLGHWFERFDVSAERG